MRLNDEAISLDNPNDCQSPAEAQALRLADRVLRGDEIVSDPAEVLSLAKVATRHGRLQAGRELTSIAARLRAAKFLAEASPPRPQ